MAAFLQDIHNVKLVFGEHLGEAVGLLDGFSYLGGLLLFCVTQAGGIKDICAHVQLFGGFLGDSQGIARHHLDPYAHRQRGRDGGLGIFAWRIEQWQHAEKLPLPVAFGPCHAQRTETASREFIDCLLDGRLYLPGIGRQFQNHLRRTLRHLEGLSVFGFDGGLGAFMHRVERLEMDYLISLQCLFVFQAAQNGQINRVVIFCARRQRAIEDDLLGGDIVHAERIT